jgi:teichuronic acid exporter
MIFVGSPWISEFYHIQELESILKISAISFIVSAVTIVPGALMTREMKFKQMAVVSLVSSILSGCLGIYMAFQNWGVWSIIFQQLLGGLIVMIGYYTYIKWSPILYYKLQSIKDMLHFGVYMFFSGFLEGIYNRIDIFLIAKVFSPASLGLYTRAQGLDVMIRNLSSGSLLNVLFPTFAKIKDDPAQLKLLYYQYFQLICFVFCLFAGVFYLSAEKLFLLLFGSQWHLSAVYFKILVLAGFAYPLSSLSLSIIEARGNSKNFFRVELIKKVLFLPTYFIAYYLGIIPFLFAFSFAMYIATFINVRFLKYELEISVWQTIKYLSAYLFPVLGIVGCISIAQSLLHIQSNYRVVLIEVLLFLVVYFSINKVFNSNGLHYTLALVKKQV